MRGRRHPDQGLDATAVRATLADFLAGRITQPALLERMRAWHAAAPDGPEDLRRAWPVERLPVVGEYFSIGNLGEGASGMVYRAVRWGPHPQVVALKLLRLIADEDKRRFFEREVEILKALACRHVARYLDSGTVHGTSYLCMELVEGTPLDEYLAAHAPTLDAKLAVFAQVARAVAELHDAGVIHRDLKPRHIIVDPTGQPHIVDLGLSAVRSDDWGTVIRRTQTQLGRIIGTIKYMSPEQAWGGLYPTDYRADIWSLGVMLFEIVTHGGSPYSAEPLEGMPPADALLYRIQHETPARPQISDPHFAASLTTLITRCLAHEPRRRLDSAHALAEDLERIRAQQHITTRPLPVTYRAERIAIGLALRARTALWSVCILGTVVAIFAAVFLLNVHWVTTADAYSPSTQQRLAQAASLRGEIDFCIAGFRDSTEQAVVEYAESNGLPGVTTDLRTWRGVHATLMNRLAAAQPLMLIWDVFFQSPQAQDGEFVRAAQVLDEAGVPIVVAVRAYRDDGEPELSRNLMDPLGDLLHTGMPTARDMVALPGEYLLAFRREDRIHASLIVAAFSALCYPHCQPEIYWPSRSEKLQLRYRKRNEGNYLGTIDDLQVHSRKEVLKENVLEKAGDLVAYAAFPLRSVEHWQERTTPYEKLLRMPSDELRRLVRGRIVMVADTRSPARWQARDLHSVRIGGKVVENVPGGYLLASGMLALIDNQHKVFQLPLLGQSFAIMTISALAACLLAVLLGRRMRRAEAPAVRITPIVVACTMSALACLLLMAEAESKVSVQVGIGGAALSLTLVPALLIEKTRYKRRMQTLAVQDAQSHRTG